MYRGLRWGNLARKRPLSIPRATGEDNIKMDIEEIEYCVD